LRLPPDDWRALIAALKADFARVGPQMMEVRQALKRWSLFINPLRRVQRATVGFASRLKRSLYEEPGPVAMAMTRAEADACNQAFARWASGTQMAGVLGTSMLAPVVAEAFAAGFFVAQTVWLVVAKQTRGCASKE
jgi:hypothetical protein